MSTLKIILVIQKMSVPCAQSIQTNYSTYHATILLSIQSIRVISTTKPGIDLRTCGGESLRYSIVVHSDEHVQIQYQGCLTLKTSITILNQCCKSGNRIYTIEI